jgi:hypothetical protein
MTLIWVGKYFSGSSSKNFPPGQVNMPGSHHSSQIFFSTVNGHERTLKQSLPYSINLSRVLKVD